MRGSKYDYDKWQELGAEGWNYENMEPYIKKLEDADLRDVDMKNHNIGGKLKVSNKESYDVPIVQAFIDAAKAQGSIEGDPNDGEGNKLGRIQYNYYDGQRQSTWVKYLKPLLNGGRLHVLPNSVVKQIIFDDDKKAIAVNFSQPHDDNISVNVKKEVILCAGAVNTPKILMLSGIGPKEHLQEHGINVLSDRPVGKNFIDHMSLFLPAFATSESKPISGAVDFIKSDASVDHANVQLFHSTLDKLVFATTFFLLPESRGEVRLRSSDPKEEPIVDPNYLSSDNDQKNFANGVKKHFEIIQAMNIADTGYVKLNLQFRDVCKKNDEVDWECVVQYNATKGNHPVGTARMGKADNPNAVVDSEWRLIGLSGVRVAVASFMPSMVAANTQVAVMAIAEKAADMITKSQSDQ